jgi:hypothetical protein
MLFVRVCRCIGDNKGTHINGNIECYDRVTNFGDIGPIFTCGEQLLSSACSHDLAQITGRYGSRVRVGVTPECDFFQKTPLVIVKRTAHMRLTIQMSMGGLSLTFVVANG